MNALSFGRFGGSYQASRYGRPVTPDQAAARIGELAASIAQRFQVGFEIRTAAAAALTEIQPGKGTVGVASKGPLFAVTATGSNSEEAEGELKTALSCRPEFVDVGRMPDRVLDILA